MRGARAHIAAVSALMAAAGAATGQDSVAVSGGLPGDAVEAYATNPSEQINSYAIDLAEVRSSWGGRFAIGPLAKTSRAGASVLFSDLLGSCAAGGLFVEGALPDSTYPLWHAPGEGISAAANAVPADSVAAPGPGASRFGACMFEFGPGPDGHFGDGNDESNVVSVVAGFSFREPNRLLVRRTVAATSKSGNFVSFLSGTASFGVGGVDEDGRVVSLVDGFGFTASIRRTNKSIVRVDAALRSPAIVNRLFNTGANDPAATAFLLETQASLATPTALPSSLIGRPMALTTDLASNLLVETSPGALAATRDHLPGGAGGVRGNLAVSPVVFAPLGNGTNDAATGALLLRTDAGTTTRGMTIFGLDADGSVDGRMTLELPTTPAAIVDPSDGFSPGTAFAPLTDHEFTAYQSQTTFRGGNGQVALTVLSDGRLVATAPVAASGGGGALPATQDNYLAVAVADEQQQVFWLVAAHAGGPGGSPPGKAIRGDYGADGIPGTADAGEGDGVLDTTPIGRIVPLSVVDPQRDSGPSISAAAMDAAGNLYFTASVELNAVASPRRCVALLRANFVSVAAGYSLELLAAEGDVVEGVNSTLPYRIEALGLADADSAESGAVWSSATVHDLLPGADVSSLPVGAPARLGALVFRARVIYDFDNDGQFVDPSQSGGSGPDQAYEAMMVLMPRIGPADINRDGSRNTADFFEFFGAFFSTGFDYNSDGASNTADFFEFFADFFTG